MSKLFIIIALIVALFIIKHLIDNKSRSKTSVGVRRKTGGSESLEYMETVQCSFCGTHIPRTGAYQSDNHYFCDEAHARASKR